MKFQKYTYNSQINIRISKSFIIEINDYYNDLKMEDITFIFLKEYNGIFKAIRFEKVPLKAKTTNKTYVFLEPKYVKWLFNQVKMKNEYLVIIHNHIYKDALEFSKSDISLLGTYYKFFNNNLNNVKFFGSILVNFDVFTGIAIYNEQFCNINCIIE